MGVRAEIYRLIDQLIRDGVAVLLISSEIKELLLLSDRVVVMREGRLVSEFSGPELSELNIGGAALGRRPRVESLLHVPKDALSHHDRIVDDQPDGARAAVETVARAAKAGEIERVYMVRNTEESPASAPQMT